jgi:hypothetical protein
MKPLVALPTLATLSLLLAGCSPAGGTPASDSLVQTSRQLVAEKSALDKSVADTQSSLNSSTKVLQDEFRAKGKLLQDEVRADPKYRPLIAEMDALQKKLSDAGTAAQDEFKKSTGPARQKVATDNAIVQGLIPVARKEKGYDDSMTWNVDTQTWSKVAK